MSRRDDAPSVRIIGHKRYILEQRNLLCEYNQTNPRMIFDFCSRTVRLYYPQGKAFVLETRSDMTEKILKTLVISEQEAMEFMNKHPDGIKERVYVRYFGEPEEL